MSKRDKLIQRLLSKPSDFTWDEVTAVMGACNFRMHKKSGSARTFVHATTKTIVRLHEPHPQNTILHYMAKQLIEGLRAAGEIESE